MPEENEEKQENELSPERRERVIARYKCGYAYREAARMQWQAEHAM